MTTTAAEWRQLGQRLADTLYLQVAPVAIAFDAAPPADVAPFDAPLSDAQSDGRQGRVPAGCVFWIHGAERAFTTVPADHGNCSVGSYTHGMVRLEDVAGNEDVAALLESGWVSPDDVGRIPALSTRPGAVTYAPLAELPESVAPDVVLLRVNGRQLMVLSDALPGLSIEGKPQCHIVAIAAEQGRPAASVGCALSRARTGMRPEEMTCALPAAGLAALVDEIEKVAGVDSTVAKYAAADARRFS